jgi:hypothetical protein
VPNSITHVFASVSARFVAVSVKTACCARKLLADGSSPFPAEAESASASVLACGDHAGDLTSTQGALDYPTAFAAVQWDFAYPQMYPDTRYEVVCAASGLYGTSSAHQFKTAVAPAGSGVVDFDLMIWGEQITTSVSESISDVLTAYFSGASGFFAEGIRPWHVSAAAVTSNATRSAQFAIVTLSFSHLVEDVRAAAQIKLEQMRTAWVERASEASESAATVFDDLVPLLVSGGFSGASNIAFYVEPAPVPPPIAETETSVNVDMGISIPNVHPDTTVDQIKAAIAAWFGVSVEDIVGLEMSFSDTAASSTLADRRLSDDEEFPVFASVTFTIRAMNNRDAEDKKSTWETLSMNSTTITAEQDADIDNFYTELRFNGVRAANSTVKPITRGVLVDLETLAAEPIVVPPNITALIDVSDCSSVSEDYNLANLAQERADVALSRATQGAARCGLAPPVSPSAAEPDSAADSSADPVADTGVSTGGVVGILFVMAVICGGSVVAVFLYKHRNDEKKRVQKELTDPSTEMTIQYQNNPRRLLGPGAVVAPVHGQKMPPPPPAAPPPMGVNRV